MIPRWDGATWRMGAVPMTVAQMTAWWQSASPVQRAVLRASNHRQSVTRAAGTRRPSPASLTATQRRDRLRARARRLVTAEQAARSHAEAERFVASARLISKATRRLAELGRSPGARDSAFNLTGDPTAFR